jgi:CheY-like chemotaxis protein
MSGLKTVLVVEDDVGQSDLLRYAAEKAPSGLAFHFVRTGEDAVSYLEGQGKFSDRGAHPLPDLVLLDLLLPRMSGFEVLSWIRHHPLLSDLRVFVWTDAGEPDVLNRATQAGANCFVPKSVVFVRGGLAGLLNDISGALTAPAQQTGYRVSRVHHSWSEKSAPGGVSPASSIK